MVSKFDAVLHPLQGAPAERLGVCAMGDVAPGDTLTSMHVVVLQLMDDGIASSSGTGGQHLGGHAVAPTEKLPMKGPRWMVQTRLEQGSMEFSTGAALATAVALVEHADGTKDIEQWSQLVAVMSRADRPHH